MRRYAFYLAVALLTFGISCFSVFEFSKIGKQSLSNEVVENVKKIEEVKIENKHGCKDDELVLFWEQLDKQHFLKFRERKLKAFKIPPDFQESWGVDKDFNCSYFNGIEKQIDINNDGEKELFISGVWYMRDGEMLVFRKINNQYKVILYDLGGFDTEVLENKTQGFFDIKRTTNWSGGGRSITIYKFKGKKYVEKECFTEDHWISKNGDMIKVEKPVVKRVKCDFD